MRFGGRRNDGYDYENEDMDASDFVDTFRQRMRTKSSGFISVSVSDIRSIPFIYRSMEDTFHSRVVPLNECADGPQPKYGIPLQYEVL